MAKGIKPHERQKAFVLALINGPKTVRELDEWVANYLNTKDLISEPTRNRDLANLRKRGYEIDVEYPEGGGNPIYKLLNFELSFPLMQEDFCMLLELINLGFNMKLLKHKPLLEKVNFYTDLIKTKKGQIKLDVFNELIKLEYEDLKRIRQAINKRCAIEFIYQRPSDGKKVDIKGYPKEIILMDKFLYLTVKVAKPMKWRDYRLDRMIPPKGSKHIVLNKRNIDPDPNDCKPRTYLKVKVIPPLSQFFEPSLWNLNYTNKQNDGSVFYSGYTTKPRFRILKDALALLPHIEIKEDPDLAKEFKEIIKKSYEKIISK